ncbi:hypothetical protein, partial [Pseudomonas koreensis]|uniref:hypothetical protein n=1 Tax=Pseudomonas koreensis TaxID=198620 RepID=UPI001CC2F517
MKKRSVRLYHRISHFRWDSKKSGDNSDQRGIPLTKRLPSTKPKTLRISNTIIVTRGGDNDMAEQATAN